MRRSLACLICCVAPMLLVPWEYANGTGDFSSHRWLENGGVASEMSPEFYWEMEVKRMAKDFHPAEKRVLPDAIAEEAPEEDAEDAAAVSPRNKQTQSTDVADFEDAIKTGGIKPPDPASAKAAHEAARKLVSTAKETTVDPLPEEFASEFSDYHRGAFAYKKGEAHFREAREAWQALLKRPKEERHYRTVWAAFMLGKLALAEKDPEAVNWFRQTRELAKEGFADPLGLAADSYGWEARGELDQGHDEEAAKLYLTQLALGDDSAIVSLKAVIPDRPSIDGMKNYAEEPQEGATPDQVKEWEEARMQVVQARLDTAALSPVLRRLVTAHVLATETQEQYWSYGGDNAGDRCRNWLATLEKAGLKEIEDADQLGWVAYTAGRYEEAESWLAVTKQDSATSLWLKAKLQRRDGKIADATKTMDEAFKLIHAEKSSSGYRQSEFVYSYEIHLPYQSAAGDLAGMYLSRGDFVNAVNAFLAGDLWGDAAFVGDCVFTVDELKNYVDDRSPEDARMRWMLARRLVREDRYTEARAYFPEREQGVLDRYVAALNNADNAKHTKAERARAYFSAAWIARYDGMEIMGTEVEPDGFVSGGNFSPGNLDTERGEGKKAAEGAGGSDEDGAREPIKFTILVTAEERRRIAKNKPVPSKRYHYRWIAAGLAWKAAALMPDGTAELADVLNRGGSWVKYKDPKVEEKFMRAIRRRCPKTDTGRAVLDNDGFVGSLGPWSEPLSSENAAEVPAKPGS